MTATDLNTAFRRVLRLPANQRLGMRSSKYPDDPWRRGACLVLAGAVLRWLDDDRASLWHLDDGMAQHLFVRVGDWVIDGAGITRFDTFVSTWSVLSGLPEPRTRRSMYPSTVDQAEETGMEFDDWATERLARSLARAIDSDDALAALR